jgi:hypothetical protein
MFDGSKDGGDQSGLSTVAFDPVLLVNPVSATTLALDLEQGRNKRPNGADRGYPSRGIPETEPENGRKGSGRRGGRHHHARTLHPRYNRRSVATTNGEVQWFRTDEKKEAFEALKFANNLVDEVKADPYYWKWVIIAVHGAMQATLVLALTGSTQLRVLSEKSKKEVAEREEGVRKLADFMDLYRMVKRKGDMEIFVHSKPLQASNEMDRDVAWVHEMRNNFMHFLPSGWSIPIEPLPLALGNCVSIISFLAFESGNVFWYEKPTIDEVTAVLSELQAKLKPQ